MKKVMFYTIVSVLALLNVMAFTGCISAGNHSEESAPAALAANFSLRECKQYVISEFEKMIIEQQEEIIETATTTVSLNYLTVTGNTINVRSDASVNSDVIAKAYGGEVYEFLSEKKSVGGDVWYKIRIHCTTGYVHSSYVQIGGNPDNVTHTPIYHTQPTAAAEESVSSSDAVTGNLPSGSDVSVTTSEASGATAINPSAITSVAVEGENA